MELLAMAAQFGNENSGGGARLVFVFGALYFVQGLIDPAEGLSAQPVRTALGSWGLRPSGITAFCTLIAVPWALKPLFGMLTDFVPLAGMRRKSYLVAASGLSTIVFLCLGLARLRSGAVMPLGLGLVLVTATVALSDVATDALMVVRGQMLGLTGRFQAVQWTCLYASGIAAGLIGGELSEQELPQATFLVCAAAAAASFGICSFAVREPPSPAPRINAPAAIRAVLEAARSPSVAGLGGFLFLWNFNPFSNAVLQLHLTRGLGFSQRFYGQLTAMTAAASMAAGVAYGAYCRRVPMRVLTHASIALGVASSLAYVVVQDRFTAIVVTLVAGFIYMTASLIQLDLAARGCPLQLAGTFFALLMGVENLASMLSTWVGGVLYEANTERFGATGSFQLLVVVSAAFTAASWLVVPWLSPALFQSSPNDLAVEQGKPDIVET